MVGGVWDIAWHHTLGRDAFWSPPHLVLYSGVGLMGLVCLAVVMRTTVGRSVGPWVDATLVERWGLRAPRGFALVGVGALGAVLSAPFDDAWHRLFGIDVTIWSPPHLFGIASAGAMRLGLLVALVDEMALAAHAIPRRQLRVSWRGVTLAEGMLLVLFSILQGNLLFALGAHEFRIASRAAGLYPLLASLAVPLVLVAGVRTLGRLGAATLIVLLLLVFQVLLRAGLQGTGFVLPPPWPCGPCIWCRRRRWTSGMGWCAEGPRHAGMMPGPACCLLGCSWAWSTGSMAPAQAYSGRPTSCCSTPSSCRNQTLCMPRVKDRAFHHVSADSSRVANASSWLGSTICASWFFSDTTSSHCQKSAQSHQNSPLFSTAWNLPPEKSA
jgi:hypothetical protein